MKENDSEGASTPNELQKSGDVVSRGLERVEELIEEINSGTGDPDEAFIISKLPLPSRPAAITSAIRCFGLRELNNLLGDYLSPEMKEQVEEILESFQ